MDEVWFNLQWEGGPTVTTRKQTPTQTQINLKSPLPQTLWSGARPLHTLITKPTKPNTHLIPVQDDTSTIDPEVEITRPFEDLDHWEWHPS